jgi:hypothetical protein
MKPHVFPVFSAILLLNLAACLSAGAVGVYDRINITTVGVGNPPVYAKPNDGVDDTLQINAAINSGSAPSRSIYFPPGTYNYAGPMTLPANVSFRLYGDGPGVSTIIFTGSGINGPTMGQATLNVEGLTLSAGTSNCGTAISARFDGSGGKFHSATIHNVQIQGSPRDASPYPFWNDGIYLYKAQNSFIDKVEITGGFSLSEGTETGIFWESDQSATSGLNMTNLEIKFVNSALKTRGWVENLYLSGFEFVDCAKDNKPVVDLSSSAPDLGSGFQLVNGHVELFEHGIRLTNLRGAKISKLFLLHHMSCGPILPCVDDGFTMSGNILALSNCTDAVVSQCGFVGMDGGIFHRLTDENGIFLDNSHSVQIVGNYFTRMLPYESGSCIAVDEKSDVVRIVNNVFELTAGLGGVRDAYDDKSGDTYYRGNNVPPD